MSVEPEPGRTRPPMVDAAQYLGYGLTWALSTGLFLMGGWLVDRWLGTLPLFLIVGAFIGAGAGFYSLYFHLVIEPRSRSAEGARELRAGTRRSADGVVRADGRADEDERRGRDGDG